MLHDVPLGGMEAAQDNNPAWRNVYASHEMSP
jgi:hypothetical protein